MIVKHETLWREFRTTGSIEARNALIELHMPFVRWVAKGLRDKTRNKVDLDDLVSMGTLGLIQAIIRFDPDAGCTFGSFSILRIRGAMLDAIRVLDWVPNRARREATKNDISLAQIKAGLSGVEHIPSKSGDDPVVRCESKDLWATLVDSLPTRERAIFQYIYREGLTVRAIGVLLGITGSMVSRLHVVTLARFRKQMGADGG